MSSARDEAPELWDGESKRTREDLAALPARRVVAGGGPMLRHPLIAHLAQIVAAVAPRSMRDEGRHNGEHDGGETERGGTHESAHHTSGVSGSTGSSSTRATRPPAP